MKEYHCCATCKNFLIQREDKKLKMMCTRLGYETKTHYKFNCWDPREDIREKIRKEDKS